VRMVLELPPPGVQHAGKTSLRSLVLGGDDVLERCTLISDQLREPYLYDNFHHHINP